MHDIPSIERNTYNKAGLKALQKSGKVLSRFFSTNGIPVITNDFNPILAEVNFVGLTDSGLKPFPLLAISKRGECVIKKILSTKKIAGFFITK